MRRVLRSSARKAEEKVLGMAKETQPSLDETIGGGEY
jgi:hypothetical protein